jgi:DNA repair protein RecO (recombination protein O)
MAASALAETVLATHGGGGNWQNALALASGSLDALETAGEKDCPRVFIHFLWNWADLLGIRPDLRFCASCAAEVPRDKSLRYSPAEGSLLCPDCAAPGRGSFSLGPGARLWLQASENLDPSRLARVTLDDASLNQARALATAVLAGVLGKKLHTWDLV